MMKFVTEIWSGILTLWLSCSNQRPKIYVAYQNHSCKKNISWVIRKSASPGGRAVLGIGLWLQASWDYGSESRRGHGRPSLVNVLCCQVDVSATGRFLVQGSRVCACASVSVWECVCVTSKPRQWGRLGQIKALAPQKKPTALWIQENVPSYRISSQNVTKRRLISLIIRSVSNVRDVPLTITNA
jgi:hypothetical protein